MTANIYSILRSIFASGNSLRLGLLVFICLPYWSSAQTAQEIEQIRSKTNVKKLEQLSSKWSNESKKRWEKLLRVAKQNGWLLEKKDESGRLLRLEGIDIGGKPIYSRPLDVQGNITVRANHLYTGGSLGLNVHGEGMTIGVWDLYPLRLTHTSFENRAIQKDGRVFDPINDTQASHGHSTAVAGQVISSSAFEGPVDGGRQAQGVAYKANVHGYNSSEDTASLALAASQGLLVSNHSYVRAGYDSRYNVSLWDTIMYEAPYFLSVWSCGNAGGPYDKLNNAGVTKNGLGVAATYYVLNYTGPGSVNISNHAIFPSSWGPADDGRVKPDIAAHGYYVRAASSQHDLYYANGSGTSFASPTVAGAVALLQQHYHNINNEFMRSSTVKGLILHTADEAGPNPGPDIAFGWGLMNTKTAAEAVTENGGKSLIIEDSLKNSGAFVREFIASGNEKLKVTVCWTDIPGPNILTSNDSTKVLINDLDARIATVGTTYYPWKLDWSSGKTSAQGPALQGDNNRDNVEMIEVNNPVAGQKYTLTINHKGSLVGNGQRYSLIVTGLADCVANRSITAPVTGISSDNQEASSTINLTNTISSGAQAIYHAADEVVLKDGFTGIAGSQFRAYLEGCTTDYNARTAAVERAVVTYPIAPSSVEKAELPENAVYPNPGTGLFRVRLDGIPSGKVEVVAGDGQAVFGRSFKNQAEMEVDIKNSTPGIYILRVVSEQKVLTKKIVKK